MEAFNAKPKNFMGVRVTTMEADLEFKIESDALGRDLFDLVARTIGLREIWYFGLQFTDVKGYFAWLQMNKKVIKQKIKKPEETGIFHFHFLVKLYPENVEEELIQDVTRHLFFLQAKQAILSMDLYCPPEASVLLASYAVQAKFGDYDAGSIKPGTLLSEELLPQRVIDQYQMTPEMWEDRIQTWWTNNKGLSREDSELEYLKIAQDLDMYGVHYFPIKSKKESDIWLGICAYGVNVYDQENRLTPKTHFPWAEIKNISFKDKELILKTVDGPNRSLYVHNIAVNRVVLDVCVGTHNLYLRRRQPDSLEMQQMRIEAREERFRRQVERNKLEAERQAREAAERERDELKHEVEELRKNFQSTVDAMKKTEETAELLAEKAKVSEEEAMVLTQRASEAEAELQRLQISAIKTEEEKIHMERKAREAEIIASQLLEESEVRARDTESLQMELLRAHQFGRDRYSEFLPLPVTYTNQPMTVMMSSNSAGSNAGSMGAIHMIHPGYPPDPLVSKGVGQDIKSLHAEIEKERVEYIQKSQHLQEQLSELRTEIDCLKLEDRQTDHDRIHNENVRRGDNKYSSMRRSGAASGAQKAQFLENL